MLGVLLVVLAVARPLAALAHPGGPPPQAHISADGAQVAIELSTEPDDAAVIAAHLGLVDPDLPDAYLEGAFEDQLRQAQRQEVSQSPAMAAYLLEHVEVRQAGAVCDGEVTRLDDLFLEPAQLAYHCPDEVESVDVTVTILHAVNPAYRTFGLGRDAVPDLTVFTTASPSHTFDFTASPQPAGDGSRDGPRDGLASALPWAAVLLPAGAGLALWRWKARP